MVGSRFVHRNWGRWPLLAGLAGVLLATGQPGFPARSARAAGAPAPGWGDVDRLIGEQKYEQAATEVAALRDQARKAGDDAGWAKALIRETRLRIGLAGYETALRLLRDQPWPKDRLARAALLLYRAHAYVTYEQEYAWEIGQRERVARPTTDLKTWTREQIFAAAYADYAELWGQREALGAQPLSRLADYLEANDYPPEVRGTLRDALAYLFIELLGNTQGWTPGQSDDVFALDLTALLKGEPARSRGVNLADGAAHPLVRIAAILDDLEAWHLSRHERDAALETRLTRTKLLFAHFTADADRARIVKDLEGRSSAFRDRPWWAMGNATLAELEEQRGHNARAHTLAAAGAAAYPNAPGGLRCRSIAARLEAPDYQLQAMEVDGLGKRSLLVTHRNLAAITLRAYPVDLDGRLQRGEELLELPWGRDLRALLATHPAKEWTVSLPATTDFKSHQTFVTPPLGALGPYLLLASARPDFAERENQIIGVTFIASDLAMVSRSVDGVNEVRVLDGATGAPVAGATVTAYALDYGAHRRAVVAARQTDSEGVVRLSIGPERGRSFQFVARHGGSVAIDGPPPQPWRLGQTTEPPRSLVYTDRSIYRPGQRLLFKAIVFAGKTASARLHVVAGQDLTVSLIDPNGDEVAKRKLKTNAFGSVAGAFDIPAGRLLGTWQVKTTANGTAGVQVEEYKRPTFEVKLLDARTAARLNQRTEVEGEARYFFGLPVTAGRVRWRVSREPVYPLWWGWGRWPGPSAAPQTVAAGTASLDQEGRFRLAFTPRADERDAAPAEPSPVSYRYRVTADVTEEAGETRSAERAFRLGFATVEAALDVPAGFVRAGAPVDVKATRSNLDGAPRPGQATWTLAPLLQPAPLMPSEQPAAPDARRQAGDVETAGDRQVPRWQPAVPTEQALHAWSADKPIASGTLTHDAKGEATVALPVLAPGAYRLAYQTRDEFGATSRTQKEFVVTDGSSRPPVAVPLMLALENATVAAGGTARVLATSGFAGQPMEWDVWRAGKRVQHRRLSAAKDPPVIEFPVRAEDRGGLVVTLTAVRDHQVLTETATLGVPWDDKRLSVSLSTFRDLIRPGAKETWTVAVKAPPGVKGVAAQAELLAYMYDRSLDLFAPHLPPDPMSLWPSRASAPGMHATLGQAWGRAVATEEWARVPNAPSLHGDRLKQDAAYPIGGPGERTFGFGGLGVRSGGKPEFLAAPAPAAVMRKSSGMATLFADKALEGTSVLREPATPPAPLRSDFSETALWRPQLLTGSDGTARLEFTVPDSVTSWNVWVHAVSKELLSGSVHRETRSMKDLMVRPNLPRFLREGDRAALKVAINNASAKDLIGTVHLAVVDAETERDVAAELGLKPADLTRPFQAKAAGAATVTFAVSAPRRLRALTFKVTATAGALSDGELRPLPVLPARVHLAQSRFVTLHDKDKRTLDFPEMAAADPTRVDDQLVVTVDAQLFTTVLRALPYLITYPYECTEQTLNRFLSSAIVDSVFRDFPAVAQLAKQASARQTPTERFDAADPNRKMALEETPWLVASRGDPLDKTSRGALVDVLDPKRAAAERAAALAKLRQAQLPSGAFPWFPGGVEDPYMTLYIMYGFAKAAEFKVDVPKDIVQRGWDYLGARFRKLRDDKTMADTSDCCWEWLTFLNFVASAYPDPSWTSGALTVEDRAALLDFSFKHWRQHSPYLKGLLALTLKRAGRTADANLVWASVMDSAKTTRDEGTFWAPEDRSWLWYNDTIETQAFALRTLTELNPGDARKHGLAQWLLLNKKLNQWKSTRATAEVIYALVQYLRQDKSLAIPEEVKVTVAGKTTDMVFAPGRDLGPTKGATDRGTNQIVVPGPSVGAQTATVTVEKETKGFAFASATWQFSTEKPPAQDHGDFFQVSRTYFRRAHDGKEATLEPLAEGAKLNVGDELEVHLSLRTRHAAEYVHLRDPRGAGFEPENAVSGYRWDLGAGYYQEVRDSGANFFFDELPVGEYPLTYRVRASVAGTFHVGPATVQSIYAPEFNAYSAGGTLTVASPP